jgi:hypothetical protein
MRLNSRRTSGERGVLLQFPSLPQSHLIPSFPYFSLPYFPTSHAGTFSFPSRPSEN